MDAKTGGRGKVDFEKFRLRRFVERLVELDDVEIHSEAVPLTKLSEIIEATPKAVLFKKAGPEGVEMIAKVLGGRKRLAAAFGTTPDKMHDLFWSRRTAPLPVIEVPQDEAPVQELVLTGAQVDLTRLPFHPQHEFDGSVYLSSAIDYTIDPATGRTNSGCRRLSLRNHTDCGTNVTAPSDLKRIYQATVARGDRLPISFTVGAHPLDFIAATERVPGDELELVSGFRGESAPVVKCRTNDIRVPADAEMVLEGYLDERGYCEPEGPFGEYMGYYGAIHMDPVFHCTAITMRRDMLHQTLLHGSAFVLDRTDGGNLNALRVEAEAWKMLKTCIREPVQVYMREVSGGCNNLRVSMRQTMPGEARRAISALFGAIPRLKHVFVFDHDVDVFDDKQVEWALGTRFQADQDMMTFGGMISMPMDPSLQGRRFGAKAGFDCTMPFGRAHEIPMTRCAAKVFSGPARFQTVEQALEAGPKFFSHIVEAVGSDDGREIAIALDDLRSKGRLGRDRDGRYHLAAGRPGATGIVGELYHDPNDGL
jgi:2,5-furandicarboxylate decarboxylase 1